jgi:outer membrane protein assembly factor BamB
MMSPGRHALALCVAGLLLVSGCSGKDKKPLPGERISVMVHQRDSNPDPRVADVQIALPQPYSNRDWPQSGGSPTRAMHHLTLAAAPKQAWATSIGDGSSSSRTLLTAPVVAEGRVYTMDVDFELAAFDARTGEQLWEFAPDVPGEDDDTFGGGIAYDGGRIFVTTAYGRVLSLDGKTGRLIWSRNVPGPVRSAPTVAAGRAYIVTIDNQLTVLNAETGEKLWGHIAISESAGLLGGSSPAVNGSTVVVPYSSGELFAMRVENGRVVWSDNLTAFRRLDALATLAHIRGNPVIDRGVVYAISHSGRLVAIDQRSGGRMWERGIGGVDTPWVAGDFIFVLSNDGELFCLTRQGGRVRWVRPLPRFRNVEKKEGLIRWAGPVLAGDRLVVVGSHGVALTVSPYTGVPLGRLYLPDRTTLAPVVAGETIYFLTDDAELLAYR